MGGRLDGIVIDAVQSRGRAAPGCGRKGMARAQAAAQALSASDKRHLWAGRLTGRQPEHRSVGRAYFVAAAISCLTA